MDHRPRPGHPPVVHHADIPEREVSEGDIVFRRRRLGSAAGAQRIGASHFVVPPHGRQCPVHGHGDEEEIFYIVGGEGIGYELPGHDPAGPVVAYAVGAGDVVVQRPDGAAHTFLAGEHGLELIAFGSGSDSSIAFLPRAGVMWCGPRWVPLDSPHPFLAEAAAGPPPTPAIDPAAPRPAHVVTLAELDTGPFPPAQLRAAGRAAGAVKAGLNHVVLPPGERGAPPHCHTLEEELFVVLTGSGTLTLGEETHPLVAGDVVSRPPSTRVPHSIVAGEEELTFLVYGTHEPGDAVFYPEEGRVWVRGLDVWLDAVPSPRR